MRLHPTIVVAVVTVIALLIVFFPYLAWAGQARVYVMRGQGSYVTSPGMMSLASQLRKDRRLTVSTHNWNRYGDVVASVRALPPARNVILVGYSLGANATTWVSNAVPHRRIALIVAYDPSVWTLTLPAGPNVARALLYHNNGPDPLGHARILGPQVETTETLMPHLAVDLSQKLHAQTLRAVREVVR